VAPAPLSPKRLDAATLAAAITFAETDAARTRTAALGAAMASEDGVAHGIEAIEKLIRPMP
jgi:UDP:flavonoid glycosyltransferase YjiC (YdhE family)